MARHVTSRPPALTPGIVAPHTIGRLGNKWRLERIVGLLVLAGSLQSHARVLQTPTRDRGEYHVHRPRLTQHHGENLRGSGIRSRTAGHIHAAEERYCGSGERNAVQSPRAVRRRRLEAVEAVADGPAT